MAIQSIWEQVEQNAAAGKHPVIKINKAMEVPRPKGKPGRPKKLRKVAPFGHILLAQLYGAKARVHCLAPGCRKRLTNEQPLTCSAECTEEAVFLMQRCLQVLLKVPYKIPRQLRKVNIVKVGPPPGNWGSEKFAERLRKGRGRPSGANKATRT